jgi:hypothetical protein
MERKKNSILICLWLFIFPVYLVDAQVHDIYCYFKETYARGNTSGWDVEIEKLETHHGNSFENSLEALTARYGYIGYLIGNNHNARARKFLEETEKNLENWLNKNPQSARLHAIKAGLVGFRIGLSPLRAPFLGQQNVDAWEASIRLDPREPMGWIEKGNSLFYRPAMFGGDKKEAEAAFRKALQLADPDECNWLFSFIQVRLYECLKANGKTNEAENLRKTLQQKPGHFRWIDDL